jgi:hypothetical protein
MWFAEHSSHTSTTTSINSAVEYFTKVIFIASHLLQFHLQIVCEENVTFPDILSPNYLKLVFDIVAGIARNEDDDVMPDAIRVIYEVFMQDLVNIRIQPLNATSHIKGYFLQQWPGCIALHIDTHFRTMCMRYIQERLAGSGLPIKQSKYIAKLWHDYATSTSTTTSKDADEIEDDQQSEGSADSEHDSDNDDEDQNLITSKAITESIIDPAWIPYVELIREHNTSTETRVQAM